MPRIFNEYRITFYYLQRETHRADSIKLDVYVFLVAIDFSVLEWRPNDHKFSNPGTCRLASLTRRAMAENRTLVCVDRQATEPQNSKIQYKILQMQKITAQGT